MGKLRLPYYIKWSVRDGDVFSGLEPLGFVFAQSADHAGRAAHGERIRRNILDDDGSAAGHRMMTERHPWDDDRSGAHELVIFDHDRFEIEVERLPHVGVVRFDVFGFVRRDAHVRADVHVVADRDSAGAPQHAVRSDFGIVADLDESSAAAPLAPRAIQEAAAVEKHALAGRERWAPADDDSVGHFDRRETIAEYFVAIRRTEHVPERAKESQNHDGDKLSWQTRRGPVTLI